MAAAKKLAAELARLRQLPDNKVSTPECNWSSPHHPGAGSKAEHGGRCQRARAAGDVCARLAPPARQPSGAAALVRKYLRPGFGSLAAGGGWSAHAGVPLSHARPRPARRPARGAASRAKHPSPCPRPARRGASTASHWAPRTTCRSSACLCAPPAVASSERRRRRAPRAPRPRAAPSEAGRCSGRLVPAWPKRLQSAPRPDGSCPAPLRG